MRQAYDYVIVGAGSAGCVLASRLSEDPKVEVLVVESGPDDGHPFITMPMGVGKLMGIGSKKSAHSSGGGGGKTYLSHYAISPGGNRPDEYWVKGRTLGGSSSINGMVYARGMPADYDGWEAQGCPGWGWSTIGRCYKEMENHQLGPNEWRGVGGPLRVSMSPLNALGRAIIDAASQAGTPVAPDINDVPAVNGGAVGPQPCTIWRGQRFSAARAFLHPALRRPNLHVATETEVLGLEFEGRAVSGVRLRGKDGVQTVQARREVILSSGAIHSPKLLQLAGIGPAEHLKALGIEVRADSPNVGKNLQEHRTVNTAFSLKRGSRIPELRGLGLVASALNYFLAGRGALSTCIWEVGGLIKTAPELDRPDCQIGLTLFTYGPGGIAETPSMTFYGYMLRPESRGELAIVSADPAAPPRITANFLAEEADRAHTVALYRYMRNVVAQPALAPFIAAELTPGPAAVSDSDLVEASYATGAAGHHVAGTCRMGSDAQSVLDPDLRVRGVGHLRVVDTSVMPTMVSGNTNAPVMALAWHAAERIRAAA